MRCKNLRARQSGLTRTRGRQFCVNAQCIQPGHSRTRQMHPKLFMEPLRREQAEGVRREVERITAELRGAMARTGSPDVRHIDPGVLHRRDF